MKIYLQISVLISALLSLDYQPSSHRVRYLPAQLEVVSGLQEIEIQFEVEKGYHIQSNAPLNDNLIPTELIIECSRGVRVVGVIFPDPHAMTLDGTEDKMEVFDGKFSLRLILDFFADQQMNLPGRLCYQACDERKCYFPRCLDFTLSIDPVVHK
jgi:hypothetical protein